MRKPKQSLTDVQVQEILIAYSSGQASAKELADMYNISFSAIYRLVHKHGVGVQFPGNAVRNNGKALAVMPPEIEVVPVIHTAPVTVVADRNGVVQSARPMRRANMSTWEVKYTGSTFVEAETVEEAITEARKLGVVKRIYSVRVK